MIVKISRNIMAYYLPAKVRSQYGVIDEPLRLTDEIKQKMGGDEVAFFDAEQSEKKLVIGKRLPTQDW